MSLRVFAGTAAADEYAEMGFQTAGDLLRRVSSDLTLMDGLCDDLAQMHLARTGGRLLKAVGAAYAASCEPEGKGPYTVLLERVTFHRLVEMTRG